MHDPLMSSAFTTFATSSLVLCANLALLWGYSGAVRAKTKSVVNAEDAALGSRGATLVDADPPAVARVLRAHANAVAVVVPFVILAFLFVALGGSAAVARGTFAAFVVARLAHSLAYLAERQPWRTIAFAVSALCLLVLFVLDIRLLVA